MRKTMVEKKGGPLSLRRQCELLGLHRLTQGLYALAFLGMGNERVFHLFVSV